MSVRASTSKGFGAFRPVVVDPAVLPPIEMRTLRRRIASQAPQIRRQRQRPKYSLFLPVVIDPKPLAPIEMRTLRKAFANQTPQSQRKRRTTYFLLAPTVTL